MADKAEKQVPAQENKYSKEQFLTYHPFREKRDLLAALLKPEREYTIGEVEELIRQFEKGKVN